MKTLLIARREYLAFVKTVGFWLSLLVLPVLMAGSVFIPILMSRSGGEEASRVAILDLSGENLTPSLQALLDRPDPAVAALHEAAPSVSARQALRQMASRRDYQAVPLPEGLTPDMPLAAAEARLSQLMQAEKRSVDQVIVAYVEKTPEPHLAFHLWSSQTKGKSLEDYLRWDLHALQSAYLAKQKGVDPQVATALHDARAEISSLTPAIAAAGADDKASFTESLKENGPHFVGIVLSYLTWMSIFSSSVILLSGVIEEKSSRVLEVLLTSAPASSLLVGKVLGVFMVLLTVAGLWSAVAGGIMGYGLAFMPPDMMNNVHVLAGAILKVETIVPMLLFFVGGYLMYGITFIAIGSFCETQKEAQAIMGPIVVVLMIPMMSLQAALMSPDLPLIRYLSWVPLFTPFLMPLRVLGGAPWWEILATLGGMGAMAWLMIRLGARAFKQGALGGGKFSWKALMGLSKA